MTSKCGKNKKVAHEAQPSVSLMWDWDCSFFLSRPLQEELLFWFANIEAFNGYGIQPKFTPGAVVFCDASDYAFGDIKSE